jgi:hypothetical protein
MLMVLVFVSHVTRTVMETARAPAQAAAENAELSHPTPVSASHLALLELPPSLEHVSPVTIRASLVALRLATAVLVLLLDRLLLTPTTPLFPGQLSFPLSPRRSSTHRYKHDIFRFFDLHWISPLAQSRSSLSLLLIRAPSLSRITF